MPYIPPSSGGPAAAGTLTGTTLAANVLASSLTSVGVLASPHMTSPVVDSGGLTVAGGITTASGALALAAAAGITLTPAAGSGITLTGTATAGGATLLTMTPGAHTAVTAEVINFNHAAYTMTITGGFALQRHHVFAAPTITAGSAQTITDVATIAVSAPLAAGSAVLTNKWAILLESGKIGVPSGSAAAPSYVFSAFPTSGMYVDATHVLFSVNGVLAFYGSANQIIVPGGGASFNGTVNVQAGTVTLSDAVNIVVGTTTGTKIGTATTQKLALWNATPIVQPSAVGSATGYAAGATAVTFHSDDTYTGNVGSTAYTINGIVAALKGLGALAA